MLTLPLDSTQGEAVRLMIPALRRNAADHIAIARRSRANPSSVTRLAFVPTTAVGRRLTSSRVGSLDQADAFPLPTATPLAPRRFGVRDPAQTEDWQSSFAKSNRES